MIGISFDAAPTHTGVVIWEDERPIEVQQLKSLVWNQMAMQVWEILADGQYDWVAAEGAFSGVNPQSDAKLNKLLGTVAIYCIDHSIPYFEGSTAEIDSASGVYHKKDRKIQNKAIAELVLPVDENITLTEDICDAVAVGIWGYGKYKEYLYSKEGLDQSG